MIETCVLVGLAVIIIILRDIRDYLGTISKILEERQKTDALI